MKTNKLKNYILTMIAVMGLAVFVLPQQQVYAELPQCQETGNTDTAICQTDQKLIGGILQNVINVMLYLAGAIAVIMVVVGGIRYITSDGDPGAAGKAKNTIIYALVGLVVAVLSYAIVNCVIDRI